VTKKEAEDVVMAKANVAINDAKHLTESLSTNGHQWVGLLVN
jgi:hypothetical protein